MAVLRKFLPQLAQELTDGTLKRKPKTLPPKEAAASGGPQASKVRALLQAVLQHLLAFSSCHLAGCALCWLCPSFRRWLLYQAALDVVRDTDMRHTIHTPPRMHKE